MTGEAASTDEVRLRPALADDARIIRQFVRGEHLNPFGLNWPNFILAENNAGAVVGCVQIKPHGAQVRELASLVVLRSWRRQGVATQLIEHVKGAAGPPLWLMCGNHLARFYEPYGFQRVTQFRGLPRTYWAVYLFSQMTRRIAGSEWQVVIMVWRG